MEHPLTALERDLAALGAAWADAMPAFEASAGGAQAEVEQMSDAGLVQVIDRLSHLRREVDGLLARVASEVARRSGPDLDNGVLLCSFCHHAVHRDGWGIRVTDGRVWFIPPPHIDPGRGPRLGGRARFEVAITHTAA